MEVRPILAATFLGFALSTTTVLPAFAHAAVTSTSPANGENARTLEDVTVTANEELLDFGANSDGFVISVRDRNGLFYGDGCVTVDGTTARMPVALTDKGRYRVDYRIVSNDGHPIDGGFWFTFAGDSEREPAPAFARLPECGVEQTPVATAIAEPTEEPTTPVESTTREPAPLSSPTDMGIIPLIGLATIPVVIGAVWLVVRTLGNRESEDHLT